MAGGLIGHFATKANYEDDDAATTTTAAPETGSVVDKDNIPNPEKDEENRKKLFDAISAVEIRNIAR